MKIEPYISQLLYRYQCVTVPGFGAFLTEIQSARLEESSNSFYPPKKLVSFNPYLKNNDGLLANHLAQSEKIAYEIAVNVIQNEVSQWKTKLQEQGVFALKNVGEFAVNAEKNLVFTPSDQLNYLKESFGLTPYVSPSVKREITSVEETIIATEQPTVAFITEKRKSYSYLKYAAVFLLSAGITGSVGYKLYDNYLNQIAQETLLVETKVQKKVNQKIQEATFFIQNPLPTVTLTVAAEKMNYHVVAGAYRQEINAEKSFENLNKLGYKARRVALNKHGLYPVLYGSFPTYSEAQKAMKVIQKKHNPEAWLLIEEL
jgi:hypothetical protein